MAPLLEEEEEEEEINDMNMDNEHKENNNNNMAVDGHMKIEFGHQPPTVPKFNTNISVTPSISSTPTNAYAKINNKSTQKYVFQSNIYPSNHCQNSYSNYKKNNNLLINNKTGYNSTKNLGSMTFQNRQNLLFQKSKFFFFFFFFLIFFFYFFFFFFFLFLFFNFFFYFL